MKVVETSLPGVLLIEARVFRDDRGGFMESYHRDRYAEHGLPDLGAQDNVSYSRRGVLRGLHLQHPSGQAKLCQVLEGEIFDVAVDVRRSSAHFGQWTGVTLSGESGQQLFIPEGFAHGFCVLSDRVVFTYKCSAPYAPEHERVVRWDDPDIGVRWPVEAPTLSPRDRDAPRLRDLPPRTLPA